MTPPEDELEITHLLARAQGLSSRIATVNEIAVEINRVLDIEEILRITGRQAKWLLDFEHLSVYLCGDRPPRWVTLFGPPVEPDLEAIATQGALSQALKSRQPQRVCQPSAHFLPTYGSGIVVPLECQRQLLGTIQIASRAPQLYTIDDIRISYLLALQLAAAIGNAQRFTELNRLYAELEHEKQKSDDLLLNILPAEVAEELKQSGCVNPVRYEASTVLFADFKDFSKISTSLSYEELFHELNYCFSYFDQIVEKYNLEKLKTIGDCYMCAGGIPVANQTHALDAVLAAMEMQLFVQLRKAQRQRNHQLYWDLRIGIHSGPLIAGIVGRQKFAYDVWGDTVNTAARMEESGVPGKINVSIDTFRLIRPWFECHYRGEIPVKNKGLLGMYLVSGITPTLACDPGGMLPNEQFIHHYLKLLPADAPIPPFCQQFSV